MSADNWAVCPRCEAARQAALDTKRAATTAAYGTVPVDVFDHMREELASEEATRPRTSFREDYEFYGADEGTVGYTYRGRCMECQLECKFEGSEPFYQPASS